MVSGRRHPASASHQKRIKSPELGEPTNVVHYNQRTGRPIRTSAGKRTSGPDYLDPMEVIEDDASDLSGTEDEEGVIRPHKKRTRTPSPPPPPLSPVHPDDLDALPAERTPSPLVESNEKSVTLNFHVPNGFTGPFVVKLDRFFQQRFGSSANSKGEANNKNHNKQPGSSAAEQSHKRIKLRHTLVADTSSAQGFLFLPAELRIKIYRLLFVAQQPLDFARPHNFCLSASFLRTCKQIYEEGRSTLYSENEFKFERNRKTRSQFWSPVPKEIGYKDMRLFLHMIGANNVSMIKTLTIYFEDAIPSSSPNLTAEQRRFRNDEHLIECLHFLGRHSNLKEIRMLFNGRQWLGLSDVRFVGAIKEIKADKVTVLNRHWWPNNGKIQPSLKAALERDMKRSEEGSAI